MESSLDKGKMARRRLHTTLFAQSYSPCGKFLAVSDNFCTISVFSLTSALSPDANEESWKPVTSFKGHDGAIYTLFSTDRLLISGGTDCIKAWLWSDIIAKSAKVIWSHNIESDESLDHLSSCVETNSLVVTSRGDNSEHLFAGCGDNKVHVWDLTSGQRTMTLKGHSDYVHCVTTRNQGQECISASEDGTVRIFDTRVGRQVHVLEPYKNEMCARSEQGRWLGCVAVDKDDWLVCGGGPRLCLWHLRSLAVTTVFDTAGACANHVIFNEDQMISAGSEPYVRHWTINGDPKLQVPCSQSNVFSVQINDRTDDKKVLSIAGNSAKLDVCTNFGYKAFSLSVC